MEFVRVWKGLSPTQRGYLTIFLWGTGMCAGWALQKIIHPAGDYTSQLIGVFGCGGFSLILYLSVRQKALAAAAADTEMPVEISSIGVGWQKRRVDRIPGTPLGLLYGVAPPILFMGLAVGRLSHYAEVPAPLVAVGLVVFIWLKARAVLQ